MPSFNNIENNCTWYHSLKDEDRKQNVARFYKALELIDGDLTPDQRLELAKEWEIGIFERATSKENYEHLYNDKMRCLRSQLQR